MTEILAFIRFGIGVKEDVPDAVKAIGEMEEIEHLDIDEKDLSDPHNLYYWVTFSGDDAEVYDAIRKFKDIKNRYERKRTEGEMSHLDIYLESYPKDDRERYDSKYYNVPTSSDMEYARLMKEFERVDVRYFHL